MSDIKLFKISEGVTELPATSVALERELQVLIENNMPTFFGVAFLKTEYSWLKIESQHLEKPVSTSSSLQLSTV